MGLFNKLKNVLFEEEEVEEEVETHSTPVVEKEVSQKKVEVVESEYKPLPERNLEIKPKEPTFEKVEPNEFSERELFKSESTFKFPAFDEEEFNTSMPKVKIEEPKNDFRADFERKKEERRNDYSRLDSFKVKEEVKEEKKRFKPSPVISPVYGILDKDYKVEDIKEAPKNQDNGIISSKDLDVDSVRAKAFGKLEGNLEKNVRKSVVSNETYDVKKEEKKEEPKKVEKEIKKEVSEDTLIISEEPILEDSHKLIEERAKTIDELLKDASDDIIDVPAEELKKSKKEEEYEAKEIDKIINDDPVSEDTLENDTLENDLYDLIDSMYDNTEEGE